MDLESITLTVSGITLAIASRAYLKSAQNRIDAYVANENIRSTEFGNEIIKFSLGALGYSLGTSLAIFEIVYPLSQLPH